MISGSTMKAAVEKDLSSFLLIKQGKTKIELTMTKDHFYSNEMLGAMCRVDNSNSSTDIAQIKIYIKRVIDCYDTSGSR